MTQILIAKTDITTLPVDAIVNAALIAVYEAVKHVKKGTCLQQIIFVTFLDEIFNIYKDILKNNTNIKECK